MFIRQIDYLIALDREKHFGRAAQSCNVSQPALSGAIRNLEQELGMLIVQRGRRFHGFTQDGARVLMWARRVQAACEGLRQEAQHQEMPLEGTLRMAAVPAALPLLPRLMQASLRAYPGVRHQTHTLPVADILQRLSRFELDVGLTYLDDADPDDFDTVPVFRERYVIVASSADHFEGRSTLSWQEAADLPLCLFADNPQSRRDIDSAFGPLRPGGVPRMEVDSMTSLCAHVRRTGFYGILPHSVLCLDDMPGRLYALPMEPATRRQIGLVFLRQTPRPALLEAALRSYEGVDVQGWVDGLLAART